MISAWYSFSRRSSRFVKISAVEIARVVAVGSSIQSNFQGDETDLTDEVQFWVLALKSRQDRIRVLYLFKSTRPGLRWGFYEQELTSEKYYRGGGREATIRFYQWIENQMKCSC